MELKLFRKYKIRPSKRLGQNFLISKSVLKKIVQTADLDFNDVVLEIGPGIGNLTIELAKKVKKVIAIEKDPRMVEVLKELTKSFKNIEIIQADILKLLGDKKDAAMFKLWPGYKVVANIPYYLTSPLIRKFLEIENQPKEMVLLVQKEVAQRICAKPPKMSLLAVSVQFYAKPEIISIVSKRSFWPQPKVNSAILKITPLINKNSYEKLLVKKFFQIVKAGFSHPRKQLVNNLSRGLGVNKIKIKGWLLENGIKLSQRAEALSIEDWLKLSKLLK